MSEVIPLSRLQPYLFDRLTAPLSGGPLIMDEAAMHETIVRDLRWLLNAKSNPPKVNIAQYTTSADSVLNYGMADLTGQPVSTLSAVRIREAVRQAIVRFEPRIDPDTLVIRNNAPVKTSGIPTISLEIEAQVWLQTLPKKMERVKVHTDIDLQSGRCATASEEGPRP